MNNTKDSSARNCLFKIIGEKPLIRYGKYKQNIKKPLDFQKTQEYTRFCV